MTAFIDNWQTESRLSKDPVPAMSEESSLTLTIGGAESDLHEKLLPPSPTSEMTPKPAKETRPDIFKEFLNLDKALPSDKEFGNLMKKGRTVHTPSEEEDAQQRRRFRYCLACSGLFLYCVLITCSVVVYKLGIRTKVTIPNPAFAVLAPIALLVPLVVYAAVQLAMNTRSSNWRSDLPS